MILVILRLVVLGILVMSYLLNSCNIKESKQTKAIKNLPSLKAERDAKNTTLAKFVTNVESRIFANLSKQMVDNMFGTNCTEDTDTTAVECPLSGTATLPDGSTVAWVKDETAETITLTVTAADGSLTQLVVPVGDFKF